MRSAIFLILASALCASVPASAEEIYGERISALYQDHWVAQANAALKRGAERYNEKVAGAPSLKAALEAAGLNPADRAVILADYGDLPTRKLPRASWDGSDLELGSGSIRLRIGHPEYLKGTVRVNDREVEWDAARPFDERVAALRKAIRAEAAEASASLLPFVPDAHAGESFELEIGGVALLVGFTANGGKEIEVVLSSLKEHLQACRENGPRYVDERLLPAALRQPAEAARATVTKARTCAQIKAYPKARYGRAPGDWEAKVAAASCEALKSLNQCVDAASKQAAVTDSRERELSEGVAAPQPRVPTGAEATR